MMSIPRTTHGLAEPDDQGTGRRVENNSQHGLNPSAGQYAQGTANGKGGGNKPENGSCGGRAPAAHPHGNGNRAKHRGIGCIPPQPRDERPTQCDSHSSGCDGAGIFDPNRQLSDLQVLYGMKATTLGAILPAGDGPAAGSALDAAKILIATRPRYIGVGLGLVPIKSMGYLKGRPGEDCR